MNTDNLQIDDATARTALDEIDSHVEASKLAMADNPASVAGRVDQLVDEAATTARVEALRNRAAKQRNRGVQNLARRHSGVASLIRVVVINERVVGSTLERYFSTIEGGIYIIQKTGAFVIGDAATDKLLSQIDEKIKAMEQSAKESLDQMAVVMAAHTDKEHWLVPQYSDAAANHEIQVRSVIANRVLGVLEKFDKQLVQLQQLVWNGESEQDEIESREYDIKTQVRSLADFIRRSLEGIQKKTQPKAASTSSPAALLLAPSAAAASSEAATAEPVPEALAA